MVFVCTELSLAVYSSSILFQYTISNTFCGRDENGISLLGITGYAIIQVDGKYVMLEMLLSAAPFGDVKHTGEVRPTMDSTVCFGVLTRSSVVVFSSRDSLNDFTMVAYPCRCVMGSQASSFMSYPSQRTLYRVVLTLPSPT